MIYIPSTVGSYSPTLPIGYDSSTIDSYSPLARTKINNALDTTFGRDIDGRQIRSFVTDFLGYSSSSSASSRFAKLIERCNKLIQENNQNKSINAKAAVILQTSYDETEFFSSSTLLPQLEQLAKTHYIALKVIGIKGETFGEAISKVANELSDRPIMTLIVRGHGNENLIRLGYASAYTVSDVKAEDFACLDPKATIIIDSCLTGCNLAKRIAAIQSRSVFAYIESFRENFLTLCCDEHGYGVVAFDSANNQIARRFTYEKGVLSEAMPCCAKSERIEKIKESLFHDKKLAAEEGDAIAQYDLAIAYKDGRGILKSYEKEAEWYLKAAKQGHSTAQHNLAVLYNKGNGVSQCYEKAVELFLQAAEQGYLDSQDSLGKSYFKGEGVPKSYEIAIEWFKLAAKQGNASAQYNLGIAYSERRYNKAAKWFKRAAEQGHVEAQYNLGMCYLNGLGIDKSLEEAMKWMRKAAEQGLAQAQAFLGAAYLIGKGLPKLYDEAEKWLQKAAEQGNTAAKCDLDFLNILIKQN